MNILFCSFPFRPSIGGIETVSALLAEHFARQDHNVVLVTQTASGKGVASLFASPFRVVRRPSNAHLIELVRWADVVFHNNISLRFAWPLLAVRRPWVVAHHTWIPRRGLVGRAKRWLLRYASNIAVSRSIANDLPVPCTVVPNPYADELFKSLTGLSRNAELLFVGRLVSDKGVDILIDALARLAQRGRRVRLTVIGDGPEATALKEQAARLGVVAQIEFVGRQTGKALVSAFNMHQVLVVPSTWEEPFGVVALEAMACGCVPLVARSGGLPEAVGAAGRVVPRGDPEALARAIEELLGNPAALAAYRAQAPGHLARHERERIAHDYLEVIADAHRTHTAQNTSRAA